VKKIYLTQNGYEEMMKELEHLKKTRRREISAEIGRARELGDLRENAEYHAAKEQQAHIEKRIAELEATLSIATVIDDSEMKADEVGIGSTVCLKDMASGEEVTYHLVSEEEADIETSKISVTSPVGASLVGRKVDEIVEVKVPAGVIKYKVLEIKR
jgi:transcription elongation factor GreA